MGNPRIVSSSVFGIPSRAQDFAASITASSWDGCCTTLGIFNGSPAAAKYRLNQITVHLANELKRYLLRAHRFTLTMIRTTAEVFIHHCDNHAERPLIALGLTLRKRVKVPNFGRGEEHGRGIRAGSDTGSTADACSCV